MNAADLLEQLNALDEHEQLEAKRGEDAAGHSILETICAFANEPSLGGGYILVGAVKDETALFPVYDVTGIRNPDKVTRDLASGVRSVFNRHVQVDIHAETLEGKRVLVVFVPEAQPQDKPIFFKSQGLPRGAFRRVGNTDQHCTEDDLAVFYQGRQTETYDAQVVPDATLDDLSPDAVREYRRELQSADPDAEALAWNDTDLLKALKAIRPHGQTLRPTVAGLILFGSPAALRRSFPMMRVDYIRVPGTTWVSSPGQDFDTVEMRDPLLRLIRRSVATVLDDIPKTFHLPEGEIQREDIPRVPRKVIREAVVNALMHRSYRINSPVQIIRYANRIEIRNRGFSLKAVEQLGEPGSEPRNPVIASVLHEIRLAETKGRGISIMREMMTAAGLMPPVFESDRGADLFTGRYYFHHFLGAEDVDWLARFKEFHLSTEEARAMILLREQGAIDNATYRGINHVDTLGASKSLRRLRDAGILEQREKGSATYYRPAGTLWQSDAPANQSGDGTLSPMATPLSPKPDALSPMVEALSPMAETPLPPEIQAGIAGLGARSQPDAVREMVLRLCSLRPFTVAELAETLRRSPIHVHRYYVHPLLRAGRLAYTFPEEPKHPKQAYSTIPEEA